MDFFEKDLLLNSASPLTIYRNKILSTFALDRYFVPHGTTGKFKELVSGDTNIGINTSHGGTITTETTNAIKGESYIRFNGSTSYINLLSPTDFFPDDMPTPGFTFFVRVRLDNWAGTNQYPLFFNSDGSNELRWFSLGTGAFRYRTIQGGSTVNITTQTYSAGIHLIALTYDGSQMAAHVDAETAVTAAMGGSPVNAMTTAIFGAGSATPTLLATGDVFEFGFNFTSAISTADFATGYNELTG